MEGARLAVPGAVIGAERRFVSDQFEEGCSEAVNVAPRIGLTPETLRRHVTVCAQDCTGGRQVFGLTAPGQSEIAEPDRAVPVQ